MLDTESSPSLFTHYDRYSLRSYHVSSTILRTRKRSKTSPSKLSSPSSHQKIVNCMQKASQKTSQKHVTVKKVKATPQEKAKRKNRKSSPCPLQPVTRSSSDSPQPPSMHTSSPSTAAKCMTRQELSASGTKSTIKNQSALCTHTPVGDSGQCTCMEICIKTGNTKDPTKSCVERLKLSGAKEHKKEILNSSSRTQKLNNHILDLWKKPYASGSIQ